MNNRIIATLMLTLVSAIVRADQDTFRPVTAGKAPQTLDELWAGYDPRAEPLEVETLKQWEEDGVVLRVVRYRVAVFKGQTARVAAVYGFPRGGSKLPGLVQIHGGGQYADYRAPLTNARRGYATISIAWAGRVSAPGHQVDPEVVKLFWESKTNDPRYRLTTDWGPLDGYHAPARYPGHEFMTLKPAAWTLDAADSPRNSGWFLAALAARRALTFLEQQPEVDPQCLGVYGHSMGGKITVLTAAADARVRAAAPSCGGVSNRNTDDALFNATLADDTSLKRIACPIVFLSPANDFHGHIDDLQKALAEIKSANWRVTCAPHHNHQDTEEHQVAGLLWFDQFLKQRFEFPQTPKTSLELKTQGGLPRFTVTPDSSKRVLSVDIFYTQQGRSPGEKADMQSTIARFWRHAKATSDQKTWSADLPLASADKPLWVYANVLYPLDTPIAGAGYYYGLYTAKTVNLSSPMVIVTPEQLTAAGAKATLQPSPVIETFGEGWQKEWFTYDIPASWARRTHKVYSPQYGAPANAKLSLEVRAQQPNKLVIGVDGHAAEVMLRGGDTWQTIVLAAGDFGDAAEARLTSWNGIRELRIGPRERLNVKQASKSESGRPGAPRLLGGEWNGAAPEFRDLKWVSGN